MKKVILYIVFVLLTIFTIKAQNSNKKIGFGVAYGFADYSTPNGASFYKPGFINNTIGPTHYNLTVNIFKPVNLSATYTCMRLNNYPEPIQNTFYWRTNLGLQIRFIAPFIKDNLWFDPYISASAGFMNIENENYKNISLGGGINFWFVKSIALSVESAYHYGFGNEKSYFTSVGIKFRFGKKKAKINDSDGDGIPDEDDLCPDIPGVEEKAGCPELTKGEKRRILKNLKKNAEKIKFEKADIGIIDSCNLYMDNMANLLKTHTSIQISIECHTDTTGYESFNITLSQERAHAIRDYLIIKGVPGLRIKAKGFGSSVPVADNKTIVGRAKNRRVEIKLLK